MESIDSERRTPLTPAHVVALREQHDVRILVEPSTQRIYTSEEYETAGAEVSPSLDDCNVVLGVKEVPTDAIRPNAVYCFFSHTIKAQRYNMPMLKQIIERNATLIDYELITNEMGRRLVFFGNFAGYAGMIDALWALGQRLDTEGIGNPFSAIKRSTEYYDLGDAEAAVTEVGNEIRAHGLPEAILPFILLFTGDGQVSKGARHICNLLPTVKLRPDDIPDFASGSYSDRAVYGTVLTRRHLYRHIDGRPYRRDDFVANPREFEGAIEPLLDPSIMLINGVYWEPTNPRFVTKEWASRWTPQTSAMRVIADITCDIGGSVELTTRSTTLDEPVYVYDVATGETTDGVAGNGPVVMAVDKLPGALPRGASTSFGDSLKRFVPALARADFSQPLEDLELPAEIKRAVIVHRGKLTEHFRYLSSHLV